MPDRLETPEHARLREDADRVRNWKRFGPYLAERQWGTVREDYSADGDFWRSFTHEDAVSRAYRWGEDGLLGFTDRECRLCFSIALWNERDPILKERLFGVTGHEGNHGEDVKELYGYLDSTPTHSFFSAQYRYPQREFPYAALRAAGGKRGRGERELEISDTGVFEGNRFFDVVAEYAKASEDDMLARVTVTNCGPEAATIHVLPQLWFRNTWSFGSSVESRWARPSIEQVDDLAVRAEHSTLGDWILRAARDDSFRGWLFTENETNAKKLFGSENATRCVKDAFHERVVNGRDDAVSADGCGTKCAAWHRFTLAPGASRVLRLRLSPAGTDLADPFGRKFDATFSTRAAEADDFFATLIPAESSRHERRATRRAYAALLWSRQFYHYSPREWLDGDPGHPKPPEDRRRGRNKDWLHSFNRDVISMPDKWEYPWFAAWDLAFHMIPFARVDPEFAKSQLLLFLREWYMHPNGQIPAYEMALDDVNPPVHAWAAWRVYKMTGPRGKRDRLFLSRVFQKLLLNFTWWVNRKDSAGKNVFTGGFLGLDNIGVFDRSRPFPGGGTLQQADATAWMAFYCVTMLAIALELAHDDPAAEDLASKFFEHFVAIADAMNHLDGSGLWDADDGFYYDHLQTDGSSTPVRARSMIGIIPLFAVAVIDQPLLDRLPGFAKRMNWFLEHRRDLHHLVTAATPGADGGVRRLLAIPSPERLAAVLRHVLDENEFLSPFGVRSLSKSHQDAPYRFEMNGHEARVNYVPGESDSGLFGGNSNWRGPVWMPVNFLLIEALERYHYFYGDSFTVECPTGSGRHVTLLGASREIARRLMRLFVPDENGRIPSHGDDVHARDLPPFHEYFDGDTGRGCGARFQGWTTLVTELFRDAAIRR